MDATDKQQLADVRRSIRESAREVEERHLSEMERLDVRRMATPPPLEKEAMRWGGGYRQKRTSGNWDWFYGLTKKEQARLRENWFGGVQDPDEIEERVSIREWLDLTRRVDAARALGSGRLVNPDRYGGLNPNHLIEGTPYNVRIIWAEDDRAIAHIHKAQAGGRLGRSWRERVWDVEPDRSHVEFRTRPDGQVYPIRATEPNQGRPRQYAPMRPEDDEAF